MYCLGQWQSELSKNTIELHTDDCIDLWNGKVGDIRIVLIVQELHPDDCIAWANGKVVGIKIVSMGEVWQ